MYDTMMGTGNGQMLWMRSLGKWKSEECFKSTAQFARSITMQHNLKCEAVDIKPRLCEALTAKWNHIHNNYNPIVDTACHRDSRL